MLRSRSFFTEMETTVPQQVEGPLLHSARLLQLLLVVFHLLLQILRQLLRGRSHAAIRGVLVRRVGKRDDLRLQVYHLDRCGRRRTEVTKQDFLGPAGAFLIRRSGDHKIRLAQVTDDDQRHVLFAQRSRQIVLEASRLITFSRERLDEDLRVAGNELGLELRVDSGLSKRRYSRKQYEQTSKNKFHEDRPPCGIG